jgi:class 3 adenylate cyclase/tetratricopeptide (TPR) repeat protein
MKGGNVQLLRPTLPQPPGGHQLQALHWLHPFNRPDGCPEVLASDPGRLAAPGRCFLNHPIVERPRSVVVRLIARAVRTDVNELDLRGRPALPSEPQAAGRRLPRALATYGSVELLSFMSTGRAAGGPGMHCPRCHAENREGRRFCAECGALLILTCPSCGFANELAERFCGGCGAALTSSRTAGTPRFGSAQSYTPRHLTEKILTSKSALEGERKLITVLFADMKGSMELLADGDPEEARKILDPVLERMMEAVHRYEGTVNQVMGDGIMALFGAPLAHEDHAVRACYAALRMQDEVKRYAAEVKRSAGAAIQIRVGLNSGEVVVRSIGSDLHMDYTAVGQTTHLAARMEQTAAPGSILLTAATLRLVEGYIQVTPRGPTAVKGLPAPVEVFALTGRGPARRHGELTVGRSLSQFVGRDAELARLHSALPHAAEGHGQVVAVVGEPGVGKSRLFYEFTRSDPVRGWRLLETGGVSYGTTTSYLPVTDLLKAYFKIQAQDDHTEIRQKVTGLLRGLDRALEPIVPPLLALLDVPVDDLQWQTFDPPQRRQRTFEGVKRLLLRESQAQPVLLVVEDLHWIDGETQAFLDSMVDSLAAARVLLLVNYRPEYQPRWANKTYYAQLHVDPLPGDRAEALLQGLLGDAVDLESLKRLLFERTEGNPFFLEESVRTLVETGVLVGPLGAYRLAKPLTSVQVPATIQAVLAARIDRLPPEEKQLLQAAAVIGTDVPYGILEAIAELPETALRRGLAHLQGAEFLYETSFYPELEHTFTHALTHEVAYRSLLAERRRALHAQIVETMERLYADRLNEHVERLGHHAFRGEVWDKAVHYLRQAGVKAYDRSASREAVALLERALEALAKLPENREILERAIDLRFELRSALAGGSDIGRGLQVLREAEGLAGRLGDQRRTGWASAYLAILQSFLGDYDHGAEAAQHVLAIAEAVGDRRLPIVANANLGCAHLYAGDFSRAALAFRRMVDRIEPHLLQERFGMMVSLAAVWSHLAGCCAEMGQFVDGMTCSAEALRVAEVSMQPISQTLVELNAGWLHLRKGDFDAAIRLLDHALTLSQATTGGQFQFVWVEEFLGYARVLSGRISDGLALLERAAAEGTMVVAFRSRLLVHLGEAYLLASRPDDASTQAHRALELNQVHKERGWRAWTLRLLGEIAAHGASPDVGTGETHFHEAMALATDFGMRPLVAHCHLGLGKLYRRSGKREQAREHLTTAATMYRETDMSFWLEKAEAELTEG